MKNATIDSNIISFNWSSKGFLDRPSKVFYSTMYSLWLKFENSRPICQVSYLSIVFYKSCCTFIRGLSRNSSPLAILWTIIPVTILSFKCCVRYTILVNRFNEAREHIISKIREYIPFITNLNSPTSVISKTSRSWVSTSSSHTSPLVMELIFNRTFSTWAAKSMFRVCFGSPISTKTSTRLSIIFPQIPAKYSNFISAITDTIPNYLVVLSYRIFTHNDYTSKSFSNFISLFHTKIANRLRPLAMSVTRLNRKE